MTDFQASRLNFNFLWHYCFRSYRKKRISAFLNCSMPFLHPIDYTASFRYAKTQMKSYNQYKSWVPTFYDQFFWSYIKREWQYFWTLPRPSEALLIALRSYESQNYYRNLVTNLKPEFQLSMTEGSGVTTKGSGSTFEVCHIYLTAFCLHHALLNPKITNKIWLPI